MWRKDKQSAEEIKKWYEERFDFQFIIRPIPGNRGFDVIAIRKCSCCGGEVEQGDGFDKPAVCEPCDRKRRMANVRATWGDGERRREENRRSLDFEEVCQ